MPTRVSAIFDGGICTSLQSLLYRIVRIGDIYIYGTIISSSHVFYFLRSRCCGQCSTLTSFNDPYQACPTLAVRAEQERRSSSSSSSSMMGRDYSGVSMILIAVAVATLAGICLTLWNYFEDRHRKSMMMQSDNKTKNLRSYRDQEDVDDGVFNDRSYR